jgi:polar amino acid transport system substrate-binding protein
MVLRPLHFGIGIRRGQVELLQWLNTFVYTIKNNGELDAISRKWRELPVGELPVF